MFKMPQHVNEPTIFNVCMNVVNTITHIVLGAVAFSAIIFGIAFPGSDHLKQHIYLCVIGYILMMGQAILAFNPHTGWAVSLRYQDKKTAHLIIQVAGSALALTGSIIRITNVNNHFQSAHGIFGIIAMIMTIISLLGGVLDLFTSMTKITKIIHSCAGSLTVATAFISLCFGFDKSMYRTLMSNDSATTMIFLTLVGLVGTILSASISNFKRILNR